MMNRFCEIADQRNALIKPYFQPGTCRRLSPSQISDTPQAGLETAENLSPDFTEWSCAVVIITILNEDEDKPENPKNVRKGI